MINIVTTWNNHTGTILDSIEGFDVIDCKLCRFKHIVPIPTQEELDRIYRHEYYMTEKPLYLKRYQEDAKWWDLVYRDRYDSFEKLLPVGGRRILDIGSGPGYFLLHGKQRGWETLGIEPSSQAATHSRNLGLKIVEDFLNNKTASKLGDFDVIHMSEVLEHIPDPLGMMNIAKQMLRPGGVICVAVPNDYNPFQTALKKACGYKPWWVSPPHHINYFDCTSLQILFHSLTQVSDLSY